jgi:hypothetical protein
MNRLGAIKEKFEFEWGARSPIKSKWCEKQAVNADPKGAKAEGHYRVELTAQKAVGKGLSEGSATKCHRRSLTTDEAVGIPQEAVIIQKLLGEFTIILVIFYLITDVICLV